MSESLVSRYEVFDQRFPRLAGGSDENGPLWAANFVSVGFLWARSEAEAMRLALERRLSRNPSVRRVVVNNFAGALAG